MSKVGGSVSKKKQNKTRKRLMIMGPICLIIIGTFIFNATFYFHKIMVLEKSKSELEKQLVVLKDKEEILTSDIQKLKDPEYIAKYARENYMYSMDGEYIIKIEYDNKEEVVEEKKNNYWYIILIVSIVILFILLFVFRKKNDERI